MVNGHYGLVKYFTSTQTTLSFNLDMQTIRVDTTSEVSLIECRASVLRDFDALLLGFYKKKSAVMHFFASLSVYGLSQRATHDGETQSAAR